LINKIFEKYYDLIETGFQINFKSIDRNNEFLKQTKESAKESALSHLSHNRIDLDLQLRPKKVGNNAYLYFN
jgi:hypothetical protein